MFRYDKKTTEENSLLKKVQEDKFLKDYYTVESKSDENRNSRKIAEILKEKNIRENAIKQENARQQKLLDIAENEKHIREKEAREKEEMNNKKYRQYVRENSVELRQLESKLKLSYINKLRENQIAEKVIEKAFIREQELEETKHRLLEAQEAELEEQHEEERNYQQQRIYKEELQKQLNNQREKAEQEAMMQFLKDKAMLDEIVRHIIEEDHQRMRDELQKKIEFKEAIQEYLLIQAKFREDQNQIVAQENEEINEYLKEMEYRIKQNDEKFKLRRKQIQDLQDSACATLPNFRTENLEEEELRLEIIISEKEAQERLKEHQRFENELRRKVELQRSLQEQLKHKEERLLKDIEEEKEFQKRMLLKLAEEERIDQMTSQRKRIRQLEHKQAVEKLLAERRAQKEMTRQSQLEELERFKAAERTLQAIIEEERQKMIKEHAAKLFGFVPKLMK